MAFDLLEAINGIGNLQDIAEKDRRRVLEFVRAFAVKDASFPDTDEGIAEKSEHRGAAFALVLKWIERIVHVAEKLKGNPLAYVGSDPFPSEREAVRVFLEFWDYADFAEGKIIVDDMG
jgi:hypothetical protein